MPLIKLQVSVKCPEGMKKQIALDLSKTCADCTGKPENYVQSVIEDGVVISFAGEIKNSAFLEVRGIGGLTPAVNKLLSAEICRMLEEKLKINPSAIYINFTDVPASNWGHNGSTFG